MATFGADTFRVVAEGAAFLAGAVLGTAPDGAGVAAFVATFEDPALRDGAFFAGAVPSDPDATGITGLTVRAGAAASASTWAESSGVLRRLARSPGAGRSGRERALALGGGHQ